MIFKNLASRRLANRCNNAITRAAIGNSSPTSVSINTPPTNAVASRPVSTSLFIQQRSSSKHNPMGVVATPQSHYRRWLSDGNKPPTGTEEDKEEDEKTTEEGEDVPNEEEGPSETEKLKEELADMKNQLLRSLAEQENIRSIARRDVEAAKNFSVKSFAKSLLEVADNLDRALESVDEEEASKNATLKTFAEGIEMTGNGLEKAFKSNGVESFCEQPGDEFDAEKHQALMEFEDPKLTPGTVGVVMKKGYMLNGRVLRAAEVGVIKK
mmetsp:Transcript_10696/g.25739  ORF Transcript_10696/g.25739 Transcript_10696/m.25739 type:complete len:268 (-) Transcript_10696:76-879(-)|eukprot:CAMPEP_0197183026 /NCGR_PEP_ID=MMETSP1423-20130617/7289_1 /TAXON_ID=476441 /ORGANISM="Pseudo-nitzschia heimii, Strain UNC1101" /LENGTH=267 /DNA_ID=CAMNT_0042633551 /DNA_START=93 /DNA_END=896 /DNA_ORIENTATION=+